MRKTKAEKIAEARAISIAQKAVTGVQIPMMEIVKIANLARELVAAGLDDDAAVSRVRAYCLCLMEAQIIAFTTDAWGRK